MTLSLLLLGALIAADPVIQKGEDSQIRAHLDLSASPADVFAVVSDPAAVARIDGSVRVETAPEGAYLQVTTFVDHALAKASYQTRSCPDGPLAVKQTLSKGKKGPLDAYETRWWVEAREGGSRLHYTIRAVPALPIPQFIMDRTTADGALRMLEHLRDHFAAQ